MKKIAVILLNLGGPDSQKSVQNFLFNLFYDPAIIPLPSLFRFPLAKFLSSRRAPTSRAIYAKLGGSSPILKNTQAQAQALEKTLNETPSDTQYKIFIAMRYGPPFADETAIAVKEYAPDDIILLSLYPQFSYVTTQSSIFDWQRAAKKQRLKLKITAICNYPEEKGFIQTLSASISHAYEEALPFGKPRLLLSAHGLPEANVKAGDPYPAQCLKTAIAVQKELAIDDLDSVLCFQSRVGRQKWITPSTESEIYRAGQDKVPVIIAPISFVSDHAETLVEIDIDYRAWAQRCGVPFFTRVPTVGTAPAFISGLAQMLREAVAREPD
ncbi:MAG: ferrochelatase [Alphaproteobacteria bacterium]|nr:ferrochelatase [Alphaproteobacteria bacterium]